MTKLTVFGRICVECVGSWYFLNEGRSWSTRPKSRRACMWICCHLFRNSELFISTTLYIFQLFPNNLRLSFCFKLPHQNPFHFPPDFSPQPPIIHLHIDNPTNNHPHNISLTSLNLLLANTVSFFWFLFIYDMIAISLDNWVQLIADGAVFGNVGHVGIHWF